MPRAFLIRHRRYTTEKGEEIRESSPEHKVSLPEAPTTAADTVHHHQHYHHHVYNSDVEESSISVNSNDCPDDLYNLTKLAEVSLAAASGQLYYHRHLSTIPLQTPSNHPSPSKTVIDNVTIPSSTSGYAHKLFDRDRDRGTIVKYENRSSTVSKTQSEANAKQEAETPQHECPDCGKRYSTSSNLARHRQTHRSLADKKARRCPHCDKVYVSMPAYSMHVRTHTQGCRCSYCGKCFSRPWLLQGHIRTHTGEKPFRCVICQKAFADKSNLRAHVQTHSDTKPHVCGRCGKAFALKSYLYKHEESSCMRGQRGTENQKTLNNNSFQNSSALPKMHQIQNVIYPNPNLQISSVENRNDKPIAAPTPVIVHPDRQFRSTVISPNPERVLLSFVERPNAIITTATGRCCVPLQLPPAQHSQEQPVDFSTNRDNNYHPDKHATNVSTTNSNSNNNNNNNQGTYSLGLAIAV